MKKALICIMTFVFALIFCGAVSAANGSIELVSTDSSGVQGNGSSYAPHNTAHEPYISDDGRYVAFESYAGNLVPGTSVNDTLYVKDMQTGKIISVGTGETPLISGNGQYVAFRTSKKYASADTNGMPDVYVFDITNKIYTIVSISSSGTPANNQCWPNSISRDGRYVTFLSAASNLVSGDTNGCNDIFVRDLVNKKTTRVSVSSSGSQANESSYGSAISADGRYIAFESSASNLVSGDTNGCNDVFRRDMINNTTTRISVSSSGAQANDYSYPDDISADGRYVIFESVATNLVSGDTNGCKDIFVHDMINGKTIRASLDSNGNQFFYDSCMATTSGDGRFITFYSGDYPMNTDIYVRDIITETTDQITNCEKNRNLLLRSVAPTISADGKYLAFQSYDKLVAGQSDVKPNIFRIELNVDTSSPKVVSTNPTTDANGVSLNSPITITLSDNITSGSNYAGIYLKNLNSGNNLSITKTISGNTLTINHTNPLKINTQYKVYIPAESVKNTGGNNLAEAYTYSFSTSPGSTGDTTPPTVTNVDPTSNATEVSLYAPVSITFSEVISTSTSYTGIYLKNLTSGNNLSITKTISDNILTINHINPLKTNVQYKVYLPSGAVKDAKGNELAESYGFTFNTSGGSTGDTTPPSVTSTDPLNNATEVSLTSPIILTFSENIASGDNYSGIYIKNLVSGATVSIDSKTISYNTLTIKQTNARKTNTQYSVFIPAGAIKDLEGIKLAASYNYTFTTTKGGVTGDTTPPSVTSTDPLNNASETPLTSPIIITFSENILSGANYSGIYIKNLVSGATVSIASKIINGNTLTINHTNPLKTNNQYKVYLPAGSVKDAVGNNLAVAYTYMFTTEPYSMIDSGSASFFSDQDQGNVLYTWETYQKNDGTIIIDGFRKNPVYKSFDSNFYIEKTTDNILTVTWETPGMIPYIGKTSESYFKTTSLTAVQYYWDYVKPYISVHGDNNPTIWDPSLHK